MTSAGPKAAWNARRLAFAGFMLALTVLFAILGVWQLNRLDEKLAAIALIEDRIDGDPIALPPAGEWVGFDPEVWNYRPVTLTGTFDHEEAVLAFTNLSDPKGRYGGPGYWVMTPFDLVGGGTVFVNRGFVPQDSAAEFTEGGAGPRAEMSITGVARADEEAGLFTPGPDLEAGIDWIRNIDRLTGFLDEEPEKLAPIYVDQAAREPGALPQGGETQLELRNRHLGYAYTWFGFALLTPVLLLFWWRRGE